MWGRITSLDPFPLFPLTLLQLPYWFEELTCFCYQKCTAAHESVERRKLALWVCGCGVELVCEGEAVVLLLVHTWKNITFPWLVAGEGSEATWEVGRTFCFQGEKQSIWRKKRGVEVILILFSSVSA